MGGCAGGALSSLFLLSPEVAPALCAVGAAQSGVQGAFMLGTVGFIVGGFQGPLDNPLEH